MIHHLDAWMGKTLFHPIIIRVCQKTGITQYRFALYGWIITLLTILSIRPHGWLGWFFYPIFVLIAVAQMYAVTQWPDHKLESSSDSIGWRILWWACLLLDLKSVFLEGDPHFYVPLGDVSALFALYAKTIKTIPPLEEKKRANERLAPAHRSA